MPLALDGPLAGHMALHILLMGFAAPALVLAARAAVPRLSDSPISKGLRAATLTQIALLWAWHAPAALDWALAAPARHAVLQGTLLLAACWFWGAAVSAARLGRWRAVVALLISGKAFCLLGVLLVFAPRVLYPAIATAAHHGGGPASAALADQQLAGLLMVIACPLTYVLAGVALAARWIAALDREPASP